MGQLSRVDVVADSSPGGSAAGPAAVGFIAFVTYVLTLAPAPYLLDSAELAAASFGLGVAHPPGEPLALLLGKLLTFLPLGSVAFRVGLLQAVAGAVAVALTYRLAEGLIAVADGAGAIGRFTRHILAASAGLGFGLCPGVVLSSNRPEVYSLAATLALGALLAALRSHGPGDRRDPRYALLAALLIGLGVANHPLVAGLSGLAAIIASLGLLHRSATAGRTRTLVAALAAFAIGLVAIGYLPVRAAALATGGHSDVIAWGDGRSAAGLWAILSARTFVQKAAVVHTSASPDAFPFVLIEELGPALVLLALAGVFFGARTPAARRTTATAILAAAGSSVAALWAGFDPHNPDIRGYLMVALAAVAALAAGGAAPLIGGLAKVLPRASAAIGVTASGALLVHTLVRAVPLPAGVRLADRVAADEAVRDLQAAAPPRSTLATVHFETAFLLAYQRLVEGQRPDLAWVHLGFVRGDGYPARVLRDHVDLAPLLTAHAHGPLTLAAARATGRPVVFEPDDELAPDLQAALVPWGGLWLLAAGARAGTLDERPTALGPTWVAEAALDRQVRGFFGHRALRDAAFACRHGWPITARRRLGELARLVPQDQRARALLASCPLAPR